jgi:hypothetical protein
MFDDFITEHQNNKLTSRDKYKGKIIRIMGTVGFRETYQTAAFERNNADAKTNSNMIYGHMSNLGGRGPTGFVVLHLQDDQAAKYVEYNEK